MKRPVGLLVGLSVALAAAPASAGLILSPLILDIPADQPARGDVELLNNGQERLYVVINPSEVVDAGTPKEQRIRNPDPEVLGLLATPSRVVLEPGARKFVRISMLKPPADKDRVYRVTVKPVVGALAGEATGLKVIVGYEMLVIQRPNGAQAVLNSVRNGDVVTVSNTGNTNAELFQGKQCGPNGGCEDLASNRIYANASIEVKLKPNYKAIYNMKMKDKVSILNIN